MSSLTLLVLLYVWLLASGFDTRITRTLSEGMGVRAVLALISFVTDCDRLGDVRNFVHQRVSQSCVK